MFTKKFWYWSPGEFFWSEKIKLKYILCTGNTQWICFAGLDAQESINERKKGKAGKGKIFRKATAFLLQGITNADSSFQIFINNFA